MTTKSLYAAALIAAVGLSACDPDQKPTVTLDRARTASPQFEGQGFIPPPRTISDITAILDQQKPDPEKTARLKQIADSEPPSNLPRADLGRWYFERSLAADGIGRVQQRISDLRRAEELLRGTPGPLGIRSLQELSVAELRAGLIKSALENRQRLITTLEARGAPSGVLLVSYCYMATVLSYAGEVQKAEGLVVKAEKQLVDLQTTNKAIFDIYRNDWLANILSAKGAIAENSGRYDEAEKAFRETLDQLSQAEALYPRMLQLGGNPPPAGTYENFRYVGHRLLAATLLRSGRPIEAEIEARRSLLGMLKLRGRYAVETADAVGILAQALAEQGRHVEVERLAAIAVEILESTGHGDSSFRLGNARRDLAQAQANLGRYDQAVQTYKAAERVLSQQPPEVYESLLGTNLSYGVSLLQAGIADAALKVFNAAAARNARLSGTNHLTTAEARGFAGAALVRQGKLADGIEELRQAVPTILSSRSSEEDGDSAGRDRRLKLVLESYMGALVDAQRAGMRLGFDVSAETFRIAEAARSRSVQRALTASSARAAAADPALAELVRRDQDTQKRIDSFQRVLTFVLSTPADQQEPDALASLRRQINELRETRGAARQEIEKRFPEYANLVDPAPTTLEQARAALQPGEALIATYVGDTKTFVWAVPKQGRVAFAAVPVSSATVAQMVTELRRSLDPNARSLGDIPPFDVGAAYILYSALLAPIEAGWRDANSLLIVPHGPLGQLPFSLLVSAPIQVPPDQDGQALFANYKTVPFLARKAAITQLPSVASLRALRSTPSPRGERRAFIGFGDPWFSPQQAADAKGEHQAAQLVTRGANTLVAMRGLPLVRRSAPATQSVASADLASLPPLPDTADEVRSIAAALNADPIKDVMVGREANERRVRSMDLANRKVVMFATHGLVPGDLNGLSQPALALSAPNVADVDGDGLLTVDEILALKLNADWVVLSACNTATGDGAGAEAVSGLGRAFFYAGTRALLVSNWPVETTSARALTTDLFRRQAQNAMLSRAEALRQAMLALIDGPGFVDPETKRPLFSYAHPIFWAPFSLVGDGGGSWPGS